MFALPLSRAKHWVERRLLAPLFRPLFRINTPSKPLNVLADRFRQAMERDKTVPTINKTWSDFCASVRAEARSGDVANFLHWPTIRKTMFGADAPFIREEINRLKARKDWTSHWKPALQEDSFGGPVPSRYFVRSSPALIHHAHHLATLEETTGHAADAFDVIVEFGGGYGSMCRLVRRLGFKGTYVIFDLPPLSALQQLYLNGLGWPTSLLSEVSAIGYGQTYLCSTQSIVHEWLDARLRGLANARGLFIATWSLSEAPVELRQPFIKRLSLFSAALVTYQSRFEEIDNDQYFRSAEQSLPSWTFRHNPIPGMDLAAGQYWIGVRPHAK